MSRKPRDESFVDREKRKEGKARKQVRETYGYNKARKEILSKLLRCLNMVKHEVLFIS